MNYIDKTFSNPLPTKFQMWYKLLVWGFIVTIGISTIGCKKDNDNDEYYVKYEVNSSTIYYGGKLEVTITLEANEALSFTVNQKSLWETVIGPVRKDFTATLKVKSIGNTHDKLKLYSNIYVSKNNSAFALKKSDGSDLPRDSLELSYTIDY